MVHLQPVLTYRTLLELQHPPGVGLAVVEVVRIGTIVPRAEHSRPMIVMYSVLEADLEGLDVKEIDPSILETSIGEMIIARGVKTNGDSSEIAKTIPTSSVISRREPKRAPRLNPARQQLLHCRKHLKPNDLRLVLPRRSAPPPPGKSRESTRLLVELQSFRIKDFRKTAAIL